MTYKDTKEILIKIVCDIIDKKPKDFNFDRSLKLVEDLKLDSIGLMEMIAGIEKELNIKFEDDEVLIDKMDDFQELVISSTLTTNTGSTFYYIGAGDKFNNWYMTHVVFK